MASWVSPHVPVIQVIEVTAFNIISYSSWLPSSLSSFGGKSNNNNNKKLRLPHCAYNYWKLGNSKDDHLLPWTFSSSEFIRKKLNLRVGNNVWTETCEKEHLSVLGLQEPVFMNCWGFAVKKIKLKKCQRIWIMPSLTTMLFYCS